MRDILSYPLLGSRWLTLHSADTMLPTTDGREVRLRRITEPDAEQKSLLHQLGLNLPDRLQFHQKCSADSAIA